MGACVRALVHVCVFVHVCVCVCMCVRTCTNTCGLQLLYATKWKLITDHAVFVEGGGTWTRVHSTLCRWPICGTHTVKNGSLLQHNNMSLLGHVSKIVSILLSKLSNCPNTDTSLCYYNNSFLTVHATTSTYENSKNKTVLQSHPQNRIYVWGRDHVHVRVCTIASQHMHNGPSSLKQHDWLGLT